MTVYIYVPYSDHLCARMRDSMCIRDRTNLRYIANSSDPQSLSGGVQSATWADVGDTDTLFIIGHGGKTSTNTIKWKVKDTTTEICWSPRDLALRIQGWLGASANSPRNTTIELAMCFGANNITPLNKSFGAKLKSFMPRHHLTGGVLAYEGILGNAIQGLDDAGEIMFQCEGTSRFSAGLSLLANKHFGREKDLHPRLANRKQM